MKEKIFKVIAALSLIIAVISLAGLLIVKQEIRNLDSSFKILKQENDSLKGDIRRSVDAALEEYSNVLAEASYDYEECVFDKKNPEAKVKIELLPKEYKPGVTRAYLVDENNREYELEYADGRYTGVITVPVFEKFNISHAVLDSGGNLSTQLLNWCIIPEEKVLPEIEIHSYGDVTTENVKKNNVTFYPDINISFYSRFADNTLNLKGADVVVMSGNKEKDRMPLEKDDSDMPHNLSLSGNEKTYSVKQGETLEFYAEIKVDDFTVRRLLDAVSIDKDGNRILNQKISDYALTENILVKYGDKVIYDIRDKVFG